MDYAKSLRVALAYRNMRQKELRLAVKCDPSYMSLVINGHREPSLKFTREVCRALGYKVSEFIALGEE